MARQRFIHPDIWTDPSVGTLSPTERLMFIGLFSNADDEGRLPGNPAYLRSTIFPYDDMTNAEIKSMRDNIARACPNVHIYTVKGVEYVAFTKWSNYQTPRYAKPSKYPSPDSDKVDEDLPQPCNQIDASLQLKSCNLATTDSDSDSDSNSNLDSDSGLDRESVPCPSPLNPSATDMIPYNEIVADYNSKCSGLPRVKALTEIRRRSIRARWNANKAAPLDHFRELFDRAGKSDFLAGINDRAWIADFDWLMKEQNAVKVLEGKYDNSARAPAGLKRAGPVKERGETQQDINSKALKEAWEKAKREEAAGGDKQSGDHTDPRADQRQLPE